MPATDTRVAHWLLEDIVETITTYSNESSATMIAIIGPVAASLLTIYVMLWGAGIASGQINEPFTDGAKRITRMCAIIAFALSVGIYQGSVARFFLETPSAVAAEIAAPGSTSSADPTSIADVLDESLGKGIEIGNKAWQEGSSKNTVLPPSMEGIGYYALAIMIYVSVAAVVAVAAGIIFVAFIALALLLAVGPLFILLAIFPQTQRFFEAWIGQVVNYAILFILVAVCVGMCFTLFDKFLNDLPSTEWEETVINTIKIVAASIAVVAVLIQTRSIASGLGGGVALSAQGLAGKLGGGAAGLARAGMSGSSRSGVGAGASRAIAGERVVGVVAGAAGRGIKAVYNRVRARYNRNSISEG